MKMETAKIEDQREKRIENNMETRIMQGLPRKNTEEWKRKWQELCYGGHYRA